MIPAPLQPTRRSRRGRLVLLYRPTCKPWLNPIEMHRRQFRRELTYCESLASIDALAEAAQSFFDRYNRRPAGVRSIVGAHAT